MNYNANSIQTKDFRTACRDAPSMYLGDDGQNGIFNSWLEILNNACDEAIMGRAATITVTLSNDDNTISVEDTGAGIPHGSNGKVKEVLIEIFTKAHSSGKFDHENYHKVRGIYGIGASATCVCSSFFEVVTNREGYSWILQFKEGVPQTEEAVKSSPTSSTGTKITFTPNKTLFHLADSIPAFDAIRIRKELELTSYFIPNVSFVFNRGAESYSYFSKEGIKDFAAKQITNPIHDHWIYGYKQFEDEVEVEIIGQWTKSSQEKIFVFSNGAFNADGGSPVQGVKTAITRTFNTLANTDFDGDNVRKGFVCIVNIKHPNPIYQNQVKNKIQNPELVGYTSKVVSEALRQFASQYREEFSKIVEIIDRQEKAEVAASRAREAILNQTKSLALASSKKVLMPDKLKDCEKHGNDSILLIVEGDSACSGIMVARDIETEAIFAIRGKIINFLKNPLDKVLENQEVDGILKALGCGFGQNFNEKRLRYGKIAICVDADADGYNIFCLLSTLFYGLTPKLIESGRLYWLRAPLYKLSKSGKKSIYLYSDEELAQAQTRYSGYERTRFKGLGELQAEDMKATMCHKENRQLEKLVLSDIEQAYTQLEMLMGKFVDDRREFLFDNAEFGEDYDGN